MIFPQSPALVELSWVAPSEALCVANYTVTLTNITEGNVSYVYKTTSNSTSLEISHVLLGVDYIFIVAGVDTGNRMGENSVPSDFVTFDGKLTYCSHHAYFTSIVRLIKIYALSVTGCPLKRNVPLLHCTSFSLWSIYQDLIPSFLLRCHS